MGGKSQRVAAAGLAPRRFEALAVAVASAHLEGVGRVRRQTVHRPRAARQPIALPSGAGELHASLTAAAEVGDRAGNLHGVGVDAGDSRGGGGRCKQRVGRDVGLRGIAKTVGRLHGERMLGVLGKPAENPDRSVRGGGPGAGIQLVAVGDRLVEIAGRGRDGEGRDRSAGNRQRDGIRPGVRHGLAGVGRTGADAAGGRGGPGEFAVRRIALAGGDEDAAVGGTEGFIARRGDAGAGGRVAVGVADVTAGVFEFQAAPGGKRGGEILLPRRNRSAAENVESVSRRGAGADFRSGGDDVGRGDCRGEVLDLQRPAADREIRHARQFDEVGAGGAVGVDLVEPDRLDADGDRLDRSRRIRADDHPGAGGGVDGAVVGIVAFFGPLRGIGVGVVGVVRHLDPVLERLALGEDADGVAGAGREGDRRGSVEVRADRLERHVSGDAVLDIAQPGGDAGHAGRRAPRDEIDKGVDALPRLRHRRLQPQPLRRHHILERHAEVVDTEILVGAAFGCHYCCHPEPEFLEFQGDRLDGGIANPTGRRVCVDVVSFRKYSRIRGIHDAIRR